MSAKFINKHFDFNEKDIAEGKYSAWQLIQPLWFNVNIYDSLDVYNQDLKPFSDAQRKILGLLWYEAEVCNGGHDQFFSNSTGIDIALEKLYEDKNFDGFEQIDKFYYTENDNIYHLMKDYVKLHASEFVVNGNYRYIEA